MLIKPKYFTFFLALTAFISVSVVYLRNTIIYSTNPEQTVDGVLIREQETGEEVAKGVFLESFPVDFPVYPDSEIESSSIAEGSEREAISVAWTADGSLSEVSEYYKVELEREGWEALSTFEDEESVIFSFEKEQSYGFIGIGKKDSDKVIISVTIGAKFERPTI